MYKNGSALLPSELAACSLSEDEIVLPLKKALDAIDILESKGIHILGWEAWVKTADGRSGHGNAPQGTVSLENLSLSESAEFCKRTMIEDSMQWASENPTTQNVLYFCLTI